MSNQIQVTGTAIFSAAGQSIKLTSASDVYLNVTRGASILNIGVDATGSFYNTNTSHRFLTNNGTITALTIASTGAATFTGNLTTNGIFIGRTNNGQAFGVGNGVDSDLGIFVQTNNIAFSNSGASSGFSFAIGGTTRLSIVSSGAATFSNILTINSSGNRPVTIDGNVNIKGDAGGWAMQHGFIGSLGTERGGFGAYGSADALSYYYIGIYGAEKMIITSGGNVLIGTTTDSGEKLQVSGITKTLGLSLSGTTVSTTQTITSAFYMWIFNGASGQTLTLYSPSGHNNTHFIKNSSANSLTLATSGNNIETLTSTTAVSSITIPAFKTVQVISNGGGVWIVMYQS